MNRRTRIAIVAGCFLLCSAGVVIENLSRQQMASVEDDYELVNAIDSTNGYHYAASDSQRKLSLKLLESIIRRDDKARSEHARIEFGSVTAEQGTVVAHILFFAPDGEMEAVLYNFVPDKNSWKIANAQRRWFVPRWRLARGLKV